MSLKKNKQIALIAFTILFLLGMVSTAWAIRPTGVSMTAPTVDPNIAAGGNFTMSGTVSTANGNENWELHFQWDSGSGGVTWTDLPTTSAGALYTSPPSSITGSPTTQQNKTVTSNGTAGNYQVRVIAIGSQTGTWTTTPVDVTVSGGATTTTTTLAPTTTTTTLAPTTTTTTLAPTTTTTTLAPTTTTTSTTTTTLPGNDKVTICHIPPGRSTKAHTLSVNVMAVPAHLRHGDTLGPCP